MPGTYLLRNEAGQARCNVPAEGRLQCLADGAATTEGALTWVRSALTPKYYSPLPAGLRSFRITLPNGSQALLKPLSTTVMGMTSQLFGNKQLILKVVADSHLARREACILRAMRGPSVPTLYCANTNMLLMENVGAPLTMSNLPDDYREQALALLRDMRSRNVQHNDLTKIFGGLKSLFGVEVQDHPCHPCLLTCGVFIHTLPPALLAQMLITPSKKMVLVDFNTGSIGERGVACEPGVRSTVPEADSMFEPSVDADVMQVLDAMYMSRRTLASYKGLRNARLGVCDAGAVERFGHGTSRRSTTPITKEVGRCDGPQSERTASGEFLFTRSVTNSTSPARAGDNQHGDGLPSFYNPMPWREDLEACVEQCARCPGCAHVSVSSRAHACLWFSSAVTCAPGASALEVQTNMQTYLRAPPAKLDHYVTVDVDRTTSPADATVCSDARTREFTNVTFRAATNWDGCGVGFRANICNVAAHGVSQDATSCCRPIFAKVSVQSPETAIGELHVREILASYLDRVLGTRLVLQVRGRLIHLTDLHAHASGDKQDTWKIRKGTECARLTNGSGDGTACQDCFGAAVVEWDPSVREASVRELQRASNWLAYAAFTYLAGCAKSDSSFFTQPGPDGRLALAMDNDRCFLPSDAEWTKFQSSVLKNHTWFGSFVLSQEAVGAMLSSPAGAALLARLGCLGPASIVKELVQLVDGDELASEIKAYLQGRWAYIGSRPAAATSTTRTHGHGHSQILHELHQRLATLSALLSNYYSKSGSVPPGCNDW